VRRSSRSADAPWDAVEAVAAALRPPGQIATLILPADVTWTDGAEPLVLAPFPSRAPGQVPHGQIMRAVEALRGSGDAGRWCTILLGGTGLTRPALEAASRISAATGAQVLTETFPARHERGAGIPAVGRLAYLVEFAAGQLAGVRHLILAGASAPVSFFAYPDQPSTPVPAGCQVHALAEAGEDVAAALAVLADLVAPGAAAVPEPAGRPEIPDGALTGEGAAAVIGALLPEGAIVSDEANTSGLWLSAATKGAPPHDWLSLTGGAIGQGLPLATGAAIACRDRPVLALEADGSAMYTASALWTHAREQLDVTTVIFSNRSYAILNMELARTGAAAGPAALDLLDLTRPEIDFTAIAAGLGVPASRATTAADFAVQLKYALGEPGPHLIEAVLPAVR
jgi:acetolactate synthase-1/2/3 large subunit